LKRKVPKRGYPAGYKLYKAQLAEYLNIEPGTIVTWRTRNIIPVSGKVGRVYYWTIELAQQIKSSIDYSKTRNRLRPDRGTL
jgi:uncharacterized protein YjcR